MSHRHEGLRGPRARIDEIDGAILDLLAERREIVDRVVDRKVEHGLPVFVPEREDEKVSAYRAAARERGLDPDWAEDFLRMIMGASRATQSAARFPSATAEPRRVLMVGGRGGMGRLYTRFLVRAGHHVDVLDADDWDEAETLGARADLAIVTVPIQHTEAVIARLAPHLRPDAALADFTSNKAAPLRAMLEAHPGPVVGLHPMHGPDVQNLSKQLMVVSPGREREAWAWFEDQARLWGMRIVEAAPERHDHVMHLVQGLRHFVALLHGAFMERYDLRPEDILEYSSPIYRAELMMTGRIFAQDPSLYAEIVLASPERRALLLQFLDHNAELARLVRDDDHAGFVAAFQSVTDFFGSFAEQALDESGYLINRLADRFA